MTSAEVAAPEPLATSKPLLWMLPPAYVATCLLLALLLGAPGYVGLRYLGEPDLDAATAAFFQGLAPDAGWRRLGSLIAWTALPFYILLMLRSLPALLSEARSRIQPLLADPQTYDRAFRRITNRLPPLLIAAVAGLIVHPSWMGAAEQSLGVVETAFQGLRIGFYVLILGLFVWLYGSTVWGIHDLGSHPLRLQPLTADAMMGMQPFGSLATAVSITYLGFVALLLMIVVLGREYTGFAVLVAVSTLFGGATAVFPLRGVHSQMLAAKQVHLEQLRRELLQPLDSLTPTGRVEAPTVWDANRVAVLEATERKVAAALEWPIDTAGMRGIGAIVASILIALATRYVFALIDAL